MQLIARRKTSGLVAALIALTLSTGLAHAQQTAGTKVAVVSLRKVFSDSTEVKRRRKEIEDATTTANSQGKLHQAEIEDMQNKLKQFKFGSPEYKKATDELDQKSLQYQMAAQVASVGIARDQSALIKTTFDDAAAAANDIAKREGFDLVLVDNSTEIPPEAINMKPDALSNLLNSHTILFTSDRTDITAKVITSMESKYTPAAPAK